MEKRIHYHRKIPWLEGNMGIYRGLYSNDGKENGNYRSRITHRIPQQLGRKLLPLVVEVGWQLGRDLSHADTSLLRRLLRRLSVQKT